MSLQTLSILILLLPAGAAVLVGAIGLRGLRDRSHWLTLLGVGGALAAAVALFQQVRAGHVSATMPIYDWMDAGVAAWLAVAFRVDQLTCVMLLTVLAISLMVVVYSVGYMRDHHGHAERGYERFFAFLAVFVFSMCLLVLAGNFLVLYVGWELVGLSSYLLIGFYYPKPEAAAAAKKAFIVNRVGDFGFGLGIFLIYLTFGTLDYTAVFGAIEGIATGSQEQVRAALGWLPGTDVSHLVNAINNEGRLTVIALLLFCGAAGKSAQLPLHVWLPDAMEGPTPVSALIHAATMVTAGVYMVARCNVLFAQSAIAMWLVGLIGGATALFAATIALTQFDMKRILAYSTLSQLGYMFLGLGVGAFDSAIFHLFTHAFFKACLFLGAGSVMHAMAGVIDIRRFSGLRRSMPITHWTFVIAGLALAGFPLLSAFWSKDEIIHAAMASDVPWLGYLALVTALLTAFYTFRMIAMAFWGDERLPRGVDHAHESGAWMSIPLVLLAAGAIGAGYFGVTTHAGGFAGIFEPKGAFHSFLAPVFAAAHVGHGGEEHGGHALMYVSSLIALVGIGHAVFFYLYKPAIPYAISVALGPVYRLVYNKYYVDEAYDMFVVRPLWRLGEMFHAIDRFVIDGILWLIAGVPKAAGLVLRGWQQGAMQGYALGMAACLAIILLVLLAGVI